MQVVQAQVDEVHPATPQEVRLLRRTTQPVQEKQTQSTMPRKRYRRVDTMRSFLTAVHDRDGVGHRCEVSLI